MFKVGLPIVTSTEPQSADSVTQRSSILPKYSAQFCKHRTTMERRIRMSSVSSVCFCVGRDPAAAASCSYKAFAHSNSFETLTSRSPSSAKGTFASMSGITSAKKSTEGIISSFADFIAGILANNSNTPMDSACPLSASRDPNALQFSLAVTMRFISLISDSKLRMVVRARSILKGGCRPLINCIFGSHSATVALAFDRCIEASSRAAFRPLRSLPLKSASKALTMEAQQEREAATHNACGLSNACKMACKRMATVTFPMAIYFEMNSESEPPSEHGSINL
mmetsp:Transcript_99563/g.267384  ORF Transcript_99563/g.267384 Transcript_99563/m.267384 type:complete len:281 (-) Transcript_99563:679-1521(-)